MTTASQVLRRWAQSIRMLDVAVAVSGAFLCFAGLWSREIGWLLAQAAG